MNATQTALQDVMAKAEALRKANEAKGLWDDADAKQFQGLLEQADRLKIQLQAQKAHDDLRAWGDSPDGQSVNKGIWRAAAPNEGVVNGVDENGNPTDAQGEAALKMLASKDYHAALNDYVRAQTTGKPMKSTSMKILETQISTSGGAWTLPEFRPDLIAKMPAPTSVAANVRRYTTGSNMLSFPRVIYNGAADDVTGSIYTSGMRTANGPEAPASDFTEATNPIAGRVNIQVYTRVLPVIITRELIEDGQFDVMGYVSQKIGEANVLDQDYLFVNGTGISQPRGILNHPNVSVATASGGMKVVSGGSSTLTWAGVASGSAGATDSTKGLVGIENALPPQYEQGAKWYANKSTYGAIRALVDAQARPLWNPTDSYPNFRMGTPMQLLGYPCEKDQFLADVAASSKSIIFGDVSGYIVPERLTLALEVLREVRAMKNEWIILARVRYGGDLVEDWRVKVLTTAAS